MFYRNIFNLEDNLNTKDSFELKGKPATAVIIDEKW